MSRRNRKTTEPNLTTDFKNVDKSSTAESEQTLDNKKRFWESLKDSVAKAFGTKPVKVHGQNDWRSEYYREHLKDIIKSLIKVEVNADWDIDYFKDVLLFEGKICITEYQGTNYALRCGTHGVSVYDRSNYVTIANPLLGSFERINGEDAVVIYCLDKKHFHNFSTVVEIFSCKFAMCDSSIDVNLFNSKIAYAFRCANKKDADTAKMLYDDISRGEPAVFYGNGTVDVTKDVQFFNSNVKQNFVADLIQQEKIAIRAEFLTSIGINNSNTEKKERMLYDEVNANNVEIICNIAYCEELIAEGVKKVNEMFPYLNLKITFPYLEIMRKKMEADINDTTRRDGDIRTEGD